MTFVLSKLGYSYDALEPVIDAQTMEIHYSKHHQGYLNKLNKALEGSDYAKKSIEELLIGLSDLSGSIYTAVRNNGGGFYNHSVFWSIMCPGGKDMSSDFQSVVEDAFGSVDAMKEEFGSIASGQFGSGWAWLVKNEAGDLEIMSTPNQDSPLSQGKFPLLGLDVWEHAYYLQYQNRRADYIDAWRDIVDWESVEKRYHQ